MAKFVKGQSGCPTGRGKGTLNKRTELSKLLDPHVEALITRLISLANSGDMTAMKLIIERLIPIPKTKPESIGIELPNVINEKNLSKIKKDILSSVLEGRLSADEGSKIFLMINVNFGKPTPTAKLNFLAMNAADASKVYQQIMQGQHYP